MYVSLKTGQVTEKKKAGLFRLCLLYPAYTLYCVQLVRGSAKSRKLGGKLVEEYLVLLYSSTARFKLVVQAILYYNLSHFNFCNIV